MERLQKIMAEAGIASRRQCEQLIRDGEVRVNGQVRSELPVLVDRHADTISVSGRKLRPEPKVYIILNKPKRVVCTNSDPEGRTRAIDLLPQVKERVYPVGRLDADSQGLLIMTNDGEFANLLTHPRYGVHKTYQVTINKRIASEDIETLKAGMYLRRGPASMDTIKILRRGHKETQMEITLREGRNRQIRVMLMRLGYRVKNLKRIRIGPLELKGLGPGNFRPMTPHEINMLRRLVNKNIKQPSKKPRKKPTS